MGSIQTEWTADYINNPDDDYNLVVEVCYKGNDVAIIKKIDGKLLLLLYESSEPLNIPVEWLHGLLSDVKERLGEDY